MRCMTQTEKPRLKRTMVESAPAIVIHFAEVDVHDDKNLIKRQGICRALLRKLKHSCSDAKIFRVTIAGLGNRSDDRLGL